MNPPLKRMADRIVAAEDKRTHIQRWIGQLPPPASLASTPSSSNSSMYKGQITVTIPGDSLSIAHNSRTRSFLAKVQALCLNKSRTRENERSDGDTLSGGRKFGAVPNKIEGNRIIRKIKVGESWEGVYKDGGTLVSEKRKIKDETWREIKVGGVGIGIGRGSLGPRPRSRMNFQMEPDRLREESTYMGLGAPKGDDWRLAQIKGAQRANTPEGNPPSDIRKRTSIPVPADARRVKQNNSQPNPQKHAMTQPNKEQQEYCCSSAIQTSGRYRAGDVFDDIDPEKSSPNSRAGKPSPVYHDQESDYYYDYDELYDQLDSSEDENEDGLVVKGNAFVDRRARLDRAAKMLSRESGKAAGDGGSRENTKWIL